MKKRALLFLLLLLSASSAFSLSLFRPKFALVLSGGGARGIAEIPILQELDKRGIVPDMVIGTSAGALIGGLYASGHDGDKIEEIVLTNDIMGYIMHFYAVRPRDIIPSAFSDFKTNLLTVEFGTNGIGAANALFDDQYINAFLRRYLSKVLEVKDFDDLSIPFRAIGTDITNNQMVVFDSGSLFQALRASMAIPIIFAPVQLEDGSWIIDGGMEDNLPIDLARELGADIVLAVDVSDATRAHESSEPDMSTLSGVFMGFSDYLSRPAVIEEYKNADWVIVPDVGKYTALEFDKTKEILERGREAVEENIEVFDELERRLGPYKDDMHYTPYSEIETPVIKAVLLENVPKSYRKDLEAFVGCPMDEETMLRFEDCLDEIRLHVGLKSVTYDVVDGIINVHTEAFPSMSGNISLGLSGGLGFKYDGDSTYFVYDPEFTVSGSVSVKSSLVLDFGIIVDEGISISGGLSVPFIHSFFLYGDITVKYGQLSYLSIPGTRDYNFGNDVGVFFKGGLAFVYRDKFRLDAIFGVDYTYLSGITSSSSSLSASHDVYPYVGIGFVYDNYLGTSATDDGFESSLVLTFGGDFPLESIFSYSMIFSAYGLIGPNDVLKFILDVEAATIRRPWNLAAAYMATKTGLISSDYIFVMGGIRLPLPLSLYIDAGIYSEWFDKDGAEDRGFSTSDLIPFSQLDTIDLGGYLSVGIITSFGRIGAEFYISMHPRVSLMVNIE